MIEIIPNWHPIFVHFTVALLAVSGVLFMIVFLAKNWQHRQTAVLIAEWNFWIGSAITIVTVLAGWHAYNTVAHDTPSHAAMTEHRNWAFGTLAMIAVIAVWLWLARRRGGLTVSPGFIIPVLLMLGLLGSTAWHGGEVVYRYGLGVMSMPKSEGDGHNHEHAGAQDHSADTPKESGGVTTGKKHDDHDHGEHKH